MPGYAITICIHTRPAAAARTRRATSGDRLCSVRVASRRVQHSTPIPVALLLCIRADIRPGACAALRPNTSDYSPPHWHNTSVAEPFPPISPPPPDQVFPALPGFVPHSWHVTAEHQVSRVDVSGTYCPLSFHFPPTSRTLAACSHSSSSLRSYPALCTPVQRLSAQKPCHTRLAPAITAIQATVHRTAEVTSERAIQRQVALTILLD